MTNLSCEQKRSSEAGAKLRVERKKVIKVRRLHEVVSNEDVEACFEVNVNQLTVRFVEELYATLKTER